MVTEHESYNQTVSWVKATKKYNVDHMKWNGGRIALFMLNHPVGLSTDVEVTEGAVYLFGDLAPKMVPQVVIELKAIYAPDET